MTTFAHLLLTHPINLYLINTPSERTKHEAMYAEMLGDCLCTPPIDTSPGYPIYRSIYILLTPPIDTLLTQPIISHFINTPD